jgi:hypothetical protein
MPLPRPPAQELAGSRRAQAVGAAVDLAGTGAAERDHALADTAGVGVGAAIEHCPATFASERTPERLRFMLILRLSL